MKACGRLAVPARTDPSCEAEMRRCRPCELTFATVAQFAAARQTGCGECCGQSPSRNGRFGRFALGCPHRVVRLNSWCMTGRWSTEMIVSGASGRRPAPSRRSGARRRRPTFPDPAAPQPGAASPRPLANCLPSRPSRVLLTRENPVPVGGPLQWGRSTCGLSGRRPCRERRQGRGRAVGRAARGGGGRTGGHRARRPSSSRAPPRASPRPRSWRAR